MKQHAPSAERNRHDILSVLKGLLPDRGLILEIASGTGQHAVHFAPHFPKAQWQPTDRFDQELASIRAWRDEEEVPNVLDPIALDVTWKSWPIERADAIVNINMLHIAPWEVCVALMVGASRTLPSGGRLFYYGAFLRQDRETAPSNLEFSRSLQERDPQWGVRQLEEVTEVARANDLVLEDVLDMPNNNYSVIFRRL